MSIALRRPDWTIADGTLSVLKWFAILMMLLDHFNLYYLFPRELHKQELYILGRIAAPLFAILVGYNLARPDSGTSTKEARAKRMMAWLLGFGLLSYPVDIFVAPFKTLEPNILFGFLHAVVTVFFIMKIRSKADSAAWLKVLKYTGVFAFFIVLGSIPEYGFSVTGTTVLAYLLASARSNTAKWLLLLPLLGSLHTFAFENQSYGAMLALFPLGLAMIIDVKRNLKGPRQFFYWFYPAHQLLLSAASMLIA